MELREGIIVRTIKYKESSKIAYILTEEGMLSALIRNSLSYKSKNYSYSQDVSLIGFELIKSNKKTFDTVTSGKCLNNYLNIKNNYSKMITVCEIMSLVYELHDHVEDYSKLYFLVKKTTELIEINNDNKYDKFYLLIFKFKLLFLLGVGPVFNSCVDCGSKDVVSFSVDDGGCKCALHRRGSFIYEGNLVEAAKVLYLGKLDLLNNEIFEQLYDYYPELNMMINKYYEFHLVTNKKIKNILDELKV